MTKHTCYWLSVQAGLLLALKKLEHRYKMVEFYVDVILDKTVDSAIV